MSVWGGVAIGVGTAAAGLFGSSSSRSSSKRAIQAQQQASQNAIHQQNIATDFAKDQWAQQYALMKEMQDVQLPLFKAQTEAAIKGTEAYTQFLGGQYEIMRENQQIAQQDRQRYQMKFQPIENKLVQEALAWDTDARREKEAGEAMSDVSRAQDAQRENAQQALEGYGIDPSQTRSAGLDAALRTQQAAIQAAAGNQARDNVTAQAQALQTNVANIGKGMPGQVNAAYQTGSQAGQAGGNMINQAQDWGNQTGQSLRSGADAWRGAASTMGSPIQWAEQSRLGFDSIYRNANKATNDWMQGVGGLGGTALGWYMSRAEGGEVEGPGGPKDDAIPARLSDGEYVIPAEVVRREGTRALDRLVAKAREEVAQNRQEEAQNQQAQQMQRVALSMPRRMPVYAAGGGDTDALTASQKFQQAYGRTGFTPMGNLNPGLRTPVARQQPAPAPAAQAAPAQEQQQAQIDPNAGFWSAYGQIQPQQVSPPTNYGQTQYNDDPLGFFRSSQPAPAFYQGPNGETVYGQPPPGARYSAFSPEQMVTMNGQYGRWGDLAGQALQ